jgi:hypothetical protein
MNCGQGQSVVYSHCKHYNLWQKLTYVVCTLPEVVHVSVS